MRQGTRLVTVLPWILGGFLVCFVAVSSQAATNEKKVLSIKVRTTQVRSSPAFFASAVKSLNYGDTVTALAPEGDWIRVTVGASGTGYVHSSAVTAQKIVRSGSARAVGGAVDSDDVVLAGKGFNPEVEKQYASSRRDLNFGAVDRMERRTISDSEVAAFVKAGKLKS